MTREDIKITNKDGKIVGKDPETGDIVPIELGSIQVDNIDLDERNLTLGAGSSTNRDNSTVIGGGAELDVVPDESHNEDEAVVIGTDAFSNTGWSVTIGANAESRYDEEDEGDSIITIGRNATAVGHSNVVIGQSASATNEVRQTVIGRGAEADGARHGIAIGYKPHTTGGESIVIGKESDVLANFAIGIGSEVTSSGGRAIALGDGAEASDSSSTAIGNSPVASGQRSTAISRAATADTEGSIAIGNNSTAGENGLSATAVGNESEATDSSSVALGDNATADGVTSIAIGRDANTSEDNTMVVALDFDNVLKLDDDGNLEITGELTENADL